MSKLLIRTLSSFFYVGFLPFMPGTFGSLAALGVFVLLRKDTFILAILFCLFCLLGFWISPLAEKLFVRKDSPYIVIDEVCGMWLSLLFLPYYNIKTFFLAFLLFRLFDTLKVYPAKKLERLKGGVMLDDLMAGFYTNIILQFALRISSLTTS